jgi:Flp pilus assembly protein TadG
MMRRLASLRRDARGTTVMEFGILASVFIMLLMGLFDLGQLAYAKSVLNGAVQSAARSSSLETGDTDAADQKVTEMVQRVVPDAEVVASRVSYFDFADVGRSEAWNDENNDDDCTDGEAYTDENGNGQWDRDIGATGNGGAGDVVIYSVTLKYKPSFGMPLLPSAYGERTLTAKTVKKNQPFADQVGYGSDAGTCA